MNNVIMSTILSIAAVFVLYNIFTVDYSSLIYRMGQQRVMGNIYFDIVTIDDTRYFVVYESEDKLYLTECFYTDKGEKLHIDVDNRMCIDKTGVRLEKFQACGGCDSNFEDFIVPFYKE